MLAVIGSAHSGQNRRRPERLVQLRRMAEEAGARFEAPEGLDALAETVADLAEAGVTTLAVNGGDGTLHRVVTAAMHAFDAPPDFAVLPGGTMNIVARSTGWLGAPEEALGRVISGQVQRRERSLLQVGELYGFLWGNGLLARFLEVYEEGDPTVLRAAAILGRGAASALVGGAFVKRLTRRYEGRLLVDGVEQDRRDWLAVAAGTVEQIGLGFRPFRFTDQVGHLHAVGLGSSVGRFAFELPRVYLRKPLAASTNQEWPAQRLELHADEPIGFMLDGDFHRGGCSLTVQVGPSVHFLVP